MLELDVVNESQSEAVIEVRGPGGADAAVREVVRPGGVLGLAMERPGPGGWSVAVNGEVATDWLEWPNDNPTIDLTIRIEADGSVVVQDT
jgi:accessory colonization factor AcfC